MRRHKLGLCVDGLCAGCEESNQELDNSLINSLFFLPRFPIRVDRSGPCPPEQCACSRHLLLCSPCLTGQASRFILLLLASLAACSVFVIDRSSCEL
jgi:hypothetical protein